MTPASAGSVRFRGERIEHLAADRIARMGMAVVPEGRQIFANLTVQENLQAFAANRNASENPGRWSASTTCSRAWPSGPATPAIACRAVSSRCWPLAGR